MQTRITVVYDMDEADAQAMLELSKTRQVMGTIVACGHLDALGELAALKAWAEEQNDYPGILHVMQFYSNEKAPG